MTQIEKVMKAMEDARCLDSTSDKWSYLAAARIAVEALTPESDKPETEDQEKLWNEVFSIMIAEWFIKQPILNSLLGKYTIIRK